MNIVEAYIKFKGQLIILISGMTGSGLTKLGKNISSDFKIKLINYKDYIVPDFQNKTKLFVDNKEEDFNNYDTDDAINWNKFMREIIKYAPSGVVVLSPSFPLDRIKKIMPDTHIHIKLSKQNLIDRRVKNNEKHLPENIIATATNKFTMPYYYATTAPEKTNIHKYINANTIAETNPDEYDEKLYDVVFDYLIVMIQKWLEYKDKKPSKLDNFNIIGNDDDRHIDSTTSLDN